MFEWMQQFRKFILSEFIEKRHLIKMMMVFLHQNQPTNQFICIEKSVQKELMESGVAA